MAIISMMAKPTLAAMRLMSDTFIEHCVTVGADAFTTQHLIIYGNKMA